MNTKTDRLLVPIDGARYREIFELLRAIGARVAVLEYESDLWMKLRLNQEAGSAILSEAARYWNYRDGVLDVLNHLGFDSGRGFGLFFDNGRSNMRDEIERNEWMPPWIAKIANRVRERPPKSHYSTRVEKGPAHDVVSIWQDGGLAGKLTVTAGHGDEVAALFEKHQGEKREHAQE